jgi:hypothetical protein
MHILSAVGTFQENMEAVKPLVIEDNPYADSHDRMANSYSISKRTLKWMKQFFFYLSEPIFLNSYMPTCLVREI